MKKLLRVVSVIFILSLTANAEAGMGKNMILLDNNQLLKVEARGAENFLRVNSKGPKIILWDEQFINSNDKAQLDNQNKSSTAINNIHYFGYETDNATFK